MFNFITFPLLYISDTTVDCQKASTTVFSSYKPSKEDASSVNFYNNSWYPYGIQKSKMWYDIQPMNTDPFQFYQDRPEWKKIHGVLENENYFLVNNMHNAKYKF